MHPAWVVVSALLATIAATASVQAQEVLKVQSSYVAYYNDVLLVVADGDVQVTLGRLTVRGESFAMDVRRNRLLVAGAVTLTDGGQTQTGAAFAEDLDSGTAALITTSEPPELRSIAAGMLANDAFAFPAMSGSTAEIVGRSATIGPRAFVRFGPCRVDVASGFGIYLGFPSYFVNFASADANLAQTALATANAAGSLILAGDANARTTLLIVDTQTSGLSGGLQQNLSASNAWAVGSFTASSKGDRYTDAAAALYPDQRFMVRVGGELHGGDVTVTPSYSWLTSQITIPFGAPYLQFNTNYADLTALPVPHRQTGTELNVNMPDADIGGLPLSLRAFAAAGVDTDPYGLQTVGATTFRTIWHEAAAASATITSLHISGSGATEAYLSARINADRTWYSVPHAVDLIDATGSVTRRYQRGVVFAGYELTNTRDVYPGGQQLAYPATILPQAPGYAAFDGYATFRTYSLGATFEPRPELSLALVAARHVDFPAPVPGLFPDPPGLFVLGRDAPGFYLGRPPDELSLYTRFRVTKQLSFDVLARYDFNFEGRLLTGVELQVLP